MSIKRYTASKDSSITNAYQSGLVTRGTGSNMGASDSLEVFSIYAQASTSSVELSRILVEFPISEVSSDRTARTIPASGSVNFILKLTNAEHPLSLPKDYYLQVQAVSRSWDEGTGLDMENYSDLGFVNWESASSGQGWSVTGGDFHSSPVYNQYFSNGTENLEVDITSLVEQWLTGSKTNYGIVVKLSSSLETDTRSYYTKKFFSRGSEFFFKRPYLEARYDESVKDDRTSFYVSSALAPAEDNLNTLYLYNRHRGKLVNIPAVGTGSIFLSLYSGTVGPLGNALTLHTGQTAITGGYVSTGIYSASVALNTTLDWVFDIWHNNGIVTYTTGSKIFILDPQEESNFDKTDYVVNVTNLKQIYNSNEVGRFRLFVRPKDWNPTIYTVATGDIEFTSIEDGFYKIYRIIDNYEAVSYGTGSTYHTRLSFDGLGNYFDLDMSLLEPNYTYGIKFTFFDSGQYYEQRETFKFRVEE